MKRSIMPLGATFGAITLNSTPLTGPLGILDKSRGPNDQNGVLKGRKRTKKIAPANVSSYSICIP